MWSCRRRAIQRAAGWRCWQNVSLGEASRAYVWCSIPCLCQCWMMSCLFVLIFDFWFESIACKLQIFSCIFIYYLHACCMCSMFCWWASIFLQVLLYCMLNNYYFAWEFSFCLFIYYVCMSHVSFIQLSEFTVRSITFASVFPPLPPLVNLLYWWWLKITESWLHPFLFVIF